MDYLPIYALYTNNLMLKFVICKEEKMNKKHVMYTAVSSVLLSSSLLLHSIDADAAESAKVTATSLNVRAMPSTSGAIVGK